MNISSTQHWLMEQSNRIPNRTAFLLPGKRISFLELLHQSLTTAEKLTQHGVQAGNNVGILAPHNCNFFVLVNSLWFIGAVPVPLNNRLTAHEIERQIVNAEIDSLIISDELSRQFSIQGIKNTLLINRILSEQNHNPRITFHPQKFIAENIALIMFTSGSSGKQKAVVHSFNNLFNSVAALNNFAKLSENDVWLAALSFYHIGGFMVPVRALLSGAAIAFPNSPGTDDVVSALEEFQPSHISLVPATLQRILDQNIRPNKNLKYLFLGGGPSEAKLSLRAIESGLPIVKVYGSTETCSMIAAISQEEIISKPESSGKPLLNCEIKIVDEKQNEVPAGNTGEILVKADSVMKKYFGDEEETQRALLGGWYHTGDFGSVDGDGFIYIESRQDDLIITGGENVSAKEVQSVILQNKKVSDAHVFGIDDAGWGQIICAAVVSENLSEDGLKSFLKLQIAGYKIPKQFYFVDEIPRNEMSKVDRKKLFEKIKLR